MQQGKIKKYYIEGTLRKLGFKRTGKLIKQVFGETANNWEKGSLKVERRRDPQTNGTYIHIKRNGVKLHTFNISSNNEFRDQQISEFEKRIVELSASESIGSSVLKMSISSNKNELEEEIGDVIFKLLDIKNTIRTGKQLDGTQTTFLKVHNIV